jgi:GntR family transcriptional regulator/MocR family aminotransferase
VSPRLVQARELFVALDRAAKTPLTRQLEEQLREAIKTGRLPAGQALPSTRMLAEDLGVSRGLVIRVYAQLGSEGYLTLQQGANPRVSTVGRPQVDLPRPAEPSAAPRFRYDLRPERPDVTQFPRREWLRSCRHAVLTATCTDVSYSEPHGLRPVREELARYLARARGLAVTADRVVITCGSTHALASIERVLSRRGARTIAFENPSHCVQHAVARHAGLEPVGIPVDGEGLDVEALRATEAPAVVVSPAHQFPTGVAYSDERRADLLGWAEERGGLVLEDDYDADFRYDRAPVGALQGVAPERVAYIGSTSKMLAPGLRLGWTVLPADLVDEVAEELDRTMLHLPALEQLTFADFIRRAELDRHLRRMRDVYRRRRDVLVRSLRQELPEYAVSGIAAGLHVVLELGSAEEETEMRRRAAKAGFGIQAMGEHALAGHRGPYGLLVGYGLIHEGVLPRVAHELARALHGSAGSLGDGEPLTRVA